MHIRGYIVLALFCIAGSVFAQAYKWTDEDGVVHYSDRPQPGAEEFVLPDTRTPARVTLPAASTPAGGADDEAADDEDDEEEQNSYESLAIASPTAEQTLWNIAGNLNVQLSLRPNLRRGHQIRVYFDGEPRMVSGTTFTIPEVFRGSHNLQAEVVNANGELQIRSEPIRFYVQQTTVINRNRPGPVPR